MFDLDPKAQLAPAAGLEHELEIRAALATCHRRKNLRVHAPKLGPVCRKQLQSAPERLLTGHAVLLDGLLQPVTRLEYRKSIALPMHENRSEYLCQTVLRLVEANT